MWRRLYGVLLIVRGLSPFLVLVVISVVGGILVNDVQVAMREPLQAIEGEFNNIKTQVETAQGYLNEVRQRAEVVAVQVQSFVASIAGTINSATQQINGLLQPINAAISGVGSALNSIRTALQAFINAAQPVLSAINLGCPTLHPCLSLPTIPSLSLPNLVPDIGPLVNALRTALSPLQRVFDDFGPTIEGIKNLGATLQTLPGKFGNLLNHGNQLLTDLRGVISRWASVLGIALVILAVLTLVYFVTPLIENVTRGWRLLRGLPAD